MDGARPQQGVSKLIFRLRNTVMEGEAQCTGTRRKEGIRPQYADKLLRDYY